MLQEKVILITGAASGIGRAAAEAFARQGAHLALIDKNGDALFRVVEELQEIAPTCKINTVVADLASDDLDEAVSSALVPFGRVDVLLSNVGKLVTGTFEELTPEQWHESFALNFFSHLTLCQAIIPRMRQQEKGCILVTASDQAVQPDAGLSAYATPKSALLALVKVLARELAPHIRVNAIAPGMTRTHLVEHLLEHYAREFGTDRATAEALELERRGVPLGRLLEPDEVAEAMVFLAECEACTGIIFNFSGGYIRGIGA